MLRFRPPRWSFLLLVICPAICAHAPAAEKDDGVLDTIVTLLSDKDKDVRGVGLEQVREQAKGAAATRRFADLLPKLAPEAQVGLLDALGDRGDKSAHDAIAGMLKSPDDQVRAAAYRNLGNLGSVADLPIYVRAIASADSDKPAAILGLGRLSGAEIDAAIVEAIKQAKPDARVALIGVLVDRHAADCVPAILSFGKDPDAQVRTAAMNAIGQLAGPESMSVLVPLDLKAASEPERERIDHVIVLVCARQKNVEKQALPLLAVYQKLDAADQRNLLPTLGRVGGSKVLKLVDDAIAGSEPAEHDAGIRALCNWPDSSIGAQLLELIKSSPNESDRRAALAALIRVAPLPDKRPPDGKLQMLKLAMGMVTTDTDRRLILKRASAVRTMDTLHFAASYLDDPKLRQEACATVVELAHHRELRLPNEAEFDALLDRVIAMSTNAVIVQRAKAYKAGQTYKLP